MAILITPPVIIINGKESSKRCKNKIPEKHLPVTDTRNNKTQQNIKPNYITKKCKFREHFNADLSHPDIMIQPVDNIYFSFNVIDPDLHGQTFGILRGKQINTPNGNKIDSD